MECLCIHWSSTDPESTLKMMAESVKNSRLKILLLCLGKLIPDMSLFTKEIKWYHDVDIGGMKLILSLEDCHLESLQLGVRALSLIGYECSLQFKTAIDSVNLVRHERELPDLVFHPLPIVSDNF